jgi:hypothetical protein
MCQHQNYHVTAIDLLSIISIPANGQHQINHLPAADPTVPTSGSPPDVNSRSTTCQQQIYSFRAIQLTKASASTAHANSIRLIPARCKQQQLYHMSVKDPQLAQPQPSP